MRAGSFAFFGVEIARLTHVETLLTLLTAGFVMENVSRHGEGAALFSQAGVAIGLATVVGQVYPVRGALMQTLFLAVIAINETIGPILFRYALVRSGEVTDAESSSVATASPAGAVAGAQ